MRQAYLLLTVAIIGAEPASAQGFGWLFDDAPAASRHVRPHTMRRMPDVPLPPPRPHFASDDARPAEVATAPGSEASTTSSNDGADRDPVHPDAASAPPLPPERPAELGGGSKATEAAPRAEAERPAPVASPSVAARPPAVPAPPASPPPGKPASPGAPAPGTVAPSGATTAFDPRQPAADPGCADRLKARGVDAEPTTLGPQPDARCTVVQPMHLVSATLADGATVSFPDKPTLACVTIDAFSAYVHDLLAPLAKGTWATGVASVWTGPGLECRSRDHVFGAKLSAHGQGLAVDIAQLKLADGRLVAVGEPKTDAERGFETAARAGGCGYFHTVLGPGSDSYHRTHWHFDLEVRGREGDSKYCK